MKKHILNFIFCAVLISCNMPKNSNDNVIKKPNILFINFGETEATYCMKALVELRKLNIKSELYPDAAKMKKQMNYANRREIPFVVMVGSSEVENNTYTLKNMQSGEQQECSLEELLKITTQL